MGETGELISATAADGGWSPWQSLPKVGPLTAPVLGEILDGGQAFRWNQDRDNGWTGRWSDHIVRLRLTGDGQLEWAAPRQLVERTAPALARYLGLDVDFAAIADTLPWRSDPHLARCMANFSRLRILHQPFGETLLGFLCSATKQIVQIKQMMALLAERHGSPLALRRASDSPLRRANGGQVLTPAENPPTGVSQTDALPYKQLPTWKELAAIPEAELRQCLLGFRAKYIAHTARFLAAHEGWLEETERLPYAEAKERLCSLPGVGEKVADCVLLFGAGRLEAFPVDVWILKTLATRYGLTGWRPAQLAQFGRVHFGPAAGLAQQYLFAWERAAKKARAGDGEHPSVSAS